MTSHSRVEPIVRYLILCVFSVVTVGPLVVVAITAFYKPGTPISGVSLPHSLNWGTFRSAWDSGAFAAAFRSSGLVAFAVVALVTLGSISAGYAFGTMNFRGRKPLFYLFLAGIVLPYVVMIVPIYFEFQDFHLVDSYWGLILPETGLYLAFGVFWMQAYFASVPRSLIEAARIDGASSFRILWQILVPLGKPVILTLMMLTFLSSWNEYLVPLVMSGNGDIQTVSLGLASFQGQHLTDQPSLAAASIIVAGPAVAVYALTQRSFFRGLLQGAVK
jgi:raffinose/stachyose/melibiose transport system permease protein